MARAVNGCMMVNNSPLDSHIYGNFSTSIERKTATLVIGHATLTARVGRAPRGIKEYRRIHISVSLNQAGSLDSQRCGGFAHGRHTVSSVGLDNHQVLRSVATTTFNMVSVTVNSVSGV